MAQLEIEVFGDPASQGSHAVIHGRIVQVNSAKHKRWRNAVAFAALDLVTDGWELLDEPLELTVIFYLPRPKTATRAYPSVMPDVDKLLRAVFDSLSGVIYVDDSRVVRVMAEKRYADARGPGALIRVNTLPDA